MRNISFQLTKAQILDRSKTVTRRIGWAFLRPGDRLQGVEKAMGLKSGESIKKLAVIEVVMISRGSLSNIINRDGGPWNYGKDECAKEGFPNLSPEQFVEMFCAHMKCQPDDWVTRIEFKYVE